MKKEKKGNNLYVVIYRSCDYPDNPGIEIIGYLPTKQKDEVDNKMITIKTEKELIAFEEKQDSDESDWILLKFTPDNIAVVTKGLGYYRPGGEE